MIDMQDTYKQDYETIKSSVEQMRVLEDLLDKMEKASCEIRHLDDLKRSHLKRIDRNLDKI